MLDTVWQNTIDLSALQLGKLTLASLLTALATLVLCFVVTHFVIKALQKLLGKSRMDAQLQHYITVAVRFILLLVGILIVVDQLGIPITSLIALLSVLSLAVSLAVQNILSNVAGGIVAMATKPFQVGDLISVAGNDGVVRALTLTYTQLDTLSGQRISIPNSTLVAEKIVNYTTRGRRRVEIHVTASYDAPIDTVRQALLNAVAHTQNILNAPAPEVFLSSYGESSIEYYVRCWVSAANYEKTYYALMEQIKRDFDALGVEMSYNHLNVHMIQS